MSSYLLIKFLRHAEFFPEGPANSKSYSRVVTSGHFDRLKGLLDHTSGEIVIGGESDASTKYISPTVVKDVSTDDSLMSEYAINFLSTFRCLRRDSGRSSVPYYRLLLLRI